MALLISNTFRIVLNVICLGLIIAVLFVHHFPRKVINFSVKLFESGFVQSGCKKMLNCNLMQQTMVFAGFKLMHCRSPVIDWLGFLCVYFYDI